MQQIPADTIFIIASSIGIICSLFCFGEVIGLLIEKAIEQYKEHKHTNQILQTLNHELKGDADSGNFNQSSHKIA